MWTGLLSLLLLTVGLLCFPRRPRTTRLFMIAVGLLSGLMRYQSGFRDSLPSLSGFFFVVMSVSYLVKYRKG